MDPALPARVQQEYRELLLDGTTALAHLVPNIAKDIKESSVARSANKDSAKTANRYNDNPNRSELKCSHDLRKNSPIKGRVNILDVQPLDILPLDLSVHEVDHAQIIENNEEDVIENEDVQPVTLLSLDLSAKDSMNYEDTGEGTHDNNDLMECQDCEFSTFIKSQLIQHRDSVHELDPVELIENNEAEGDVLILEALIDTERELSKVNSDVALKTSAPKRLNNHEQIMDGTTALAHLVPNIARDIGGGSLNRRNVNKESSQWNGDNNVCANNTDKRVSFPSKLLRKDSAVKELVGLEIMKSEDFIYIASEEYQTNNEGNGVNLVECHDSEFSAFSKNELIEVDNTEEEAVVNNINRKKEKYQKRYLKKIYFKTFLEDSNNTPAIRSIKRIHHSKQHNSEDKNVTTFVVQNKEDVKEEPNTMYILLTTENRKNKASQINYHWGVGNNSCGMKTYKCSSGICPAVRRTWICRNNCTYTHVPTICCEYKRKHAKVVTLFMNSHNCEKKFHCDQCEMKFTKKSHLKQHSNVEHKIKGLR